MTPSNQRYRGPKLTPTPVSDHQYTGLILDPKQRANLRSHGALIPSSVHSRNTYNRGDINPVKSPTTLCNTRGSSILGHRHDRPSSDKMSRDISTHAPTNDSPFSSDAEIHPSSGVSLNQSDNTIPTTTQSQKASFSQLAEHQGIHDWNNTVFDDRWLLKPEEIWNLSARRRDSVDSISPERPALTRDPSRSGNQMDSRIEGSQHSSTQNTNMQRLIREAEERKKELSGRQVSPAPIEARSGEKDDTLTTDGKSTASRELHGHNGNRTNQ